MPKPDFQIDMPDRKSSDFNKLPRSPRFHEDFDAPFSEAIATATPSLRSDTSDGSISPISSTDDEVTKALRKLDGQDSPNVAAWAASTSFNSNSNASNSRFKQWARKSFAIGRGRSDSEHRPPTSKSSSSISEGSV